MATELQVFSGKSLSSITNLLVEAWETTVTKTVKTSDNYLQFNSKTAMFPYWNISFTSGSYETIDDSTFKILSDCSIYYWATCVVGETPVLMANNTSKEIKDVVVGDMIKSINPNTQELINAEVTEVKKGQSRVLVLMVLSNGDFLKMTPSHPVDTKDGTKTYLGYGTEDTKLKVGDEVLTANGYVNIDKLSYLELDEPVDVYALSAKCENILLDSNSDDPHGTTYVSYIAGKVLTTSNAPHPELYAKYNNN